MCWTFDYVCILDCHTSHSHKHDSKFVACEWVSRAGRWLCPEHLQWGGGRGRGAGLLTRVLWGWGRGTRAPHPHQALCGPTHEVGTAGWHQHSSTCQPGPRIHRLAGVCVCPVFCFDPWSHLFFYLFIDFLSFLHKRKQFSGKKNKSKIKACYHFIYFLYIFFQFISFILFIYVFLIYYIAISLFLAIFPWCLFTSPKKSLPLP